MTAPTLTSTLVTTTWLKDNIDHPKLIVLDASSHMPGANRDAFSEWQEKRITGARFFDFNHKICDTTSSLPHMMPTEAVFAQEARALGIHEDSIVIIYDSLGIFSSPRAWWMLTTMGHKHCAILDGGLPQWEKDQGGIDQGLTENKAIDETASEQETAKGTFSAKLNINNIKNSHEILAAIGQETISILDARSPARFNGTAPEPREGLISGHIPSSKNLPFPSLISNGKMKPNDELKRTFAALLKPEQTLYASCGSGVTACIIAFAAHLIGIKNIAVYDGSWSEWGQPERQLPINTDQE